MTEISDTTDVIRKSAGAVELTPVMKKFVLHWGEMGTRWGVNRTVAQIHALLFISPVPLTAERLAETLSIARSNVSNSLHELMGWGVIRVVHVLGDRKDHFESLKNVWEMFQIVLDERKKREIDPTVAVLRECVAAAKKGGAAEEHSAARLREMLEFFETMTTWYQQVRKLPLGGVMKFVRLGGKLPRLLGLG